MSTASFIALVCQTFDGTFRSGSHTPVPADTPEKADRKPCFKESAGKYHWTNYHHQHGSDLGVLLGTRPELVSFVGIADARTTDALGVQV